MSQHVLSESSGPVRVLTLNRPEKKNALTRAMYQTLADEIGRADTDSAVRCVLIQGNGDMFTAGNDLNDFAAVGDGGSEEHANPFLTALGESRTPLVAAVNGRAVGVGVTMLLHCDMVFVATDAQLTTPFVNLALVPEAASSLLLPLRIGYVRAFEMFVLGEPVSAEQAVSWGLANRAVAPGQLRAAAHAAAAAIAQRAPAAVLATKTLMRDRALLAARMREEGAQFLRQLQSAEFKEAFAAFSERRPPNFQKLK